MATSGIPTPGAAYCLSAFQGKHFRMYTSVSKAAKMTVSIPLVKQANHCEQIRMVNTCMLQVNGVLHRPYPKNPFNLVLSGHATVKTNELESSQDYFPVRCHCGTGLYKM